MLIEEYHRLGDIFRPYGNEGISTANIWSDVNPAPSMLRLTEHSTIYANPRVHKLDYLRGLAAFGIMIYHYSSWTFGELQASSFLGRVGVYGVAIFYVLSGQTLSYVYSSTLTLASKDLIRFYKKRFFRIFPLLWLATIASIVLSKQKPDAIEVFLNLSGLFSLFKWNVYFATGAWSIGNELVFYLTFPLLIFLAKKHRAILFLLALLVLSISFYFTFFALQPSNTLSNQWRVYTNPLNQILFFFGGVLMGIFTQPNLVRKGLNLGAGIVGLILFSFLPVHGNAIALVSGLNRVFFSASCFLICYSFFRIARAPSFIDRPLALLGQISYSLYLLHPLIYAVTKAFMSIIFKNPFQLSSIFLIIIAVLISVVASYISFEYFEKYFIKIGNKT